MSLLVTVKTPLLKECDPSLELDMVQSLDAEKSTNSDPVTFVSSVSESAANLMSPTIQPVL